ncbi:Peptide-N(4)-(N-acetyl-beta-glucosaminyl)asparagine amidase [Melia azedarach]|uniref:Peptide-N(4)-(N-acetyl-beta-glucosaminyl)asparagine amidase n=1 Tax=Melia azedarach TaxID=155640 RepID=A0ACC1Y7C7_MELAZ|nr:Peptide-N(4)-(N-acetyl-beta-glucosaminyl)asparagine amidase [Melia azedarach]
MGTRKFTVSHRDSTFDVDYDTSDGLEIFKFQLFSLTSVPPDEQKIVGDEGDQRLVSDDSDLVTISDKLKLLSINKETVGNSANEKEEFLKSDEELARMLQAEEEALLFQEYGVREDSGQFERTIRPYIGQVLMYEDPIRQEEARKTVPIERLEEKALVSLAREGNFKPSKSEHDHAFLLQLLFWFKQTFRWVNEPPCDGCGNETVGQGMGTPLPSESQYGASRVELYRCKVCSRITRFPRYNDPLKLVETKRGRCGEWANCFTLYCRAFGYESRLILDFTDHVWTECFSQSLGRWMHLDPCEGIYDRPLLYEKGWNKKLNYVIAIAKDGVYDVTKRYTRKWHEVLARRNIATEQTVSAVLANLTRECRRSFASEAVSALEDRDKYERETLEREMPSAYDAPVSLPGRQSGDKEWRISRSEIGSDDNGSLGCASCPLRVCIDEHVTRIYNAFSPVLSYFVENDISKPKAVEVLKILKGIMVDLKKSPYKTRRVSLNSVSNDGRKIVHQLLPSLRLLLRAVSLKSELNTDGQVNIALAGDPVKTSLSLPVVMKALDDIIHDLNNCRNFDKDSLSLPLLKLHRIHSGLVQASGEELPFGIATSAFDGTRPSKWEEPNGARGCWIVYKLEDKEMLELVAYELMSANDAPERDPIDWVLEGSNDSGSSWHILDKQTSHKFENRFQRKTFMIKSPGFLSNAFRFRFLAVRDVNSTSRLQIGSIDLYASSSYNNIEIN